MRLGVPPLHGGGSCFADLEITGSKVEETLEMVKYNPTALWMRKLKLMQVILLHCDPVSSSIKWGQ